MKIIVIDNYDSFTYNLVHLIEEITGNYPEVIRNDELEIEDLESYDLLFLSPGPGVPDEAGKLKDIIKHYAAKKAIFGVCLGLQAIIEVFGGELENLDTVFHGVASEVLVTKDEAIIYKDVDSPFEAARYHSWIGSKNNFPDELEITAVDEADNIMSIEHKKYNISAVQYHPESILTPIGKKIVANFINQNNTHSHNE